MTVWVAAGALVGTVLALVVIVRENRAHKAAQRAWVNRYLDRLEQDR